MTQTPSTITPDDADDEAVLPETSVGDVASAAEDGAAGVEVPTDDATVPPSRRRARYTPAQLAPYLPGDRYALFRDAVSWAFWIPVATILRTLLTLNHMIYPRLIGIAIVAAVLTQWAAHRVTRRYWPWASMRVWRFALVAALGFVVGVIALDATTGLQLVPRAAAAAAALPALASMAWRRVRWDREAREHLAPLEEAE